MADSDAHVSSIEAIAQFAVALRAFDEKSKLALTSIEEQARKALQWLEHDAAGYWRDEVRRGFERVARTRSELLTCQAKSVAGFRPSCIDEIKAHRAAQAKLQHAESMVNIVRQWTQRVRHEVDEYKGRIAAFRRSLETDLPRSVALLNRTVSTLDAYAESTSRNSAPDEPAAPTASNEGGTTS